MLPRSFRLDEVPRGIAAPQLAEWLYPQRLEPLLTIPFISRSCWAAGTDSLVNGPDWFPVDIHQQNGDSSNPPMFPFVPPKQAVPWAFSSSPR
jgi:hypothetical protein